MTASVEPSEMQTALLDQSAAGPTTQRFDARATSDAGDAAAVAAYQPANPQVPSQSPAPTRSRRGLVVVALILVVLLAAAGLTRVLQRPRNSAAKVLVSQEFHYPGAHTIVNVGDAGGAALQIETNDPPDKVAAWYETKLKPTTTLRVTGGVVIMRNEKVTATIAAADQGTTVVIKQTAP